MAGSQGMTSIYKKGTSVYRGECRSHKLPAHTRGADPCLSRANYNKKKRKLDEDREREEQDGNFKANSSCICICLFEQVHNWPFLMSSPFWSWVANKACRDLCMAEGVLV